MRFPDDVKARPHELSVVTRIIVSQLCKCIEMHMTIYLETELK